MAPVRFVWGLAEDTFATFFWGYVLNYDRNLQDISTLKTILSRPTCRSKLLTENVKTSWWTANNNNNKTTHSLALLAWFVDADVPVSWLILVRLGFWVPKINISASITQSWGIRVWRCYQLFTVLRWSSLFWWGKQQLISWFEIASELGFWFFAGNKESGR